MKITKTKNKIIIDGENKTVVHYTPGKEKIILKGVDFSEIELLNFKFKVIKGK